MENQTNSNSSECVDVHTYLADQMHNGSFTDYTSVTSVRIIATVLYSIVLILGVCGNLGVVLSVLRNKKLQTVRNVFIFGLSCSDFLVCVTSLPATAYSVMFKTWHLGKQMCELGVVPLFQGTSSIYSAFTLTVIAVDRYILIVHPTKRPITRCQAATIAPSIWLVAVCLCLPTSLNQVFWDGVDPNSVTICGSFCMEDLTASDRIIYGISIFVLQFVVPLAIISYCYMHISFKLERGIQVRKLKEELKNQRKKSTKNENHILTSMNMSLQGSLQGDCIVPPMVEMCSVRQPENNPKPLSERQLGQLKRQQRTNRMLIAMVVLFATVQTPGSLITLLKDLGVLPQIMETHKYIIQLVAHLMQMTSSFWNPLLYGFMNDAFRRSFIDMMPCLEKLHTRNHSQASEYASGETRALRTAD